MTPLVGLLTVLGALAGVALCVWLLRRASGQYWRDRAIEDANEMLKRRWKQ